MPLIREGRPCQRHICSYITDTYVLISTCVIISVFLYKHTHDTHQRGAPIVLNPSTRLQVRKEGGAASSGSGGDGAKHPGLTPVSETLTFPYQTCVLSHVFYHIYAGRRWPEAPRSHACLRDSYVPESDICTRYAYVPLSDTHMSPYQTHICSYITDTYVLISTYVIISEFLYHRHIGSNAGDTYVT